AAGTVVAILPATWWVVEALRAGRLGVDAIAVLALAGSLLVGEYLAGALIAVMLATGRALEDYAMGRARRDLTALYERAPRRAHRHEKDGLREVDVSEVARGDLLLIPAVENVPVDVAVCGEAEDRGAVW